VDRVINTSIDTERRFALEVYPKRDICIVRGEGALLWDDQGNEYIDCAAGIGVANIGHAHPAVVAAVSRQAARLISCPGIFYNDVRAELMQKLIGVAPEGLERAFLCNSGTEAMEAAIKFARISTGKNGFVSAMRGFHGRSMGALSATFKYRQEFEPLIPGHSFVPFNNIDKLESAIDENTAAVIIELVQGEGGVRPADPRYATAVSELCKARGVLLIVDEIQTGFGRTGRMFASEVYGVSPDILAVSKAIAGGVPMGAVLCSDRIAPAVGKHGSTFGGNPLACAAAIATIETLLEQDLPGQAVRKGELLVERLSADPPPIVREIRHLGLMVGIELKTKAKPTLEALMGKGVLALPAGPTVVRLLPPLVISDEQLSRACDALLACLSV